MLKELAKKKLIISSFTFLIFVFTMLCPQVEKTNIEKTISYQTGNISPIYLLNKASYVSRTNMHLKSTSTIPKVKEIISILTINSKDSIYIPSLFTPVIPSKTKLLSTDIQGTTLKLKFDKNFLNIPPDSFKKMLECLVYSLTELEGIDNLLIYVNDSLLEKTPLTNEKLPLPLSRDMGVNKMNSMHKLTNTMSTTAYYIAKEQDYTYYIPVTFISNENKQKVEVIIEELKTRPNLNTNLISYLHANASLTNYELLNEEIKLSFNSYLLEGLPTKTMQEEVKYSIALSMKDSLHVKEVNIQVQKEKKP